MFYEEGSILPARGSPLDTKTCTVYIQIRRNMHIIISTTRNIQAVIIYILWSCDNGSSWICKSVTFRNFTVPWAPADATYCLQIRLTEFSVKELGIIINIIVGLDPTSSNKYDMHKGPRARQRKGYSLSCLDWAVNWFLPLNPLCHRKKIFIINQSHWHLIRQSRWLLLSAAALWLDKFPDHKNPESLTLTIILYMP